MPIKKFHFNIISTKDKSDRKADGMCLLYQILLRKRIEFAASKCFITASLPATHWSTPYGAAERPARVGARYNRRVAKRAK
ncbi:hypothetical protein EVAR_24653_1 [Eumeta japonica]|uniref:Uncharacterized protein n=1 Tax=Eumeta variegata TaxID=151549 RepID=A0A4C1V1U2_EUMVA|nr:hypothetical protein EVAR_24653_1 [Eumeta japonica]